jgi:hypothetical protein
MANTKPRLGEYHQQRKAGLLWKDDLYKKVKKHIDEGQQHYRFSIEPDKLDALREWVLEQGIYMVYKKKNVMGGFTYECWLHWEKPTNIRADLQLQVFPENI